VNLDILGIAKGSCIDSYDDNRRRRQLRCVDESSAGGQWLSTLRVPNVYCLEQLKVSSCEQDVWEKEWLSLVHSCSEVTGLACSFGIIPVVGSGWNSRVSATAA